MLQKYVCKLRGPATFQPKKCIAALLGIFGAPRLASPLLEIFIMLSVGERLSLERRRKRLTIEEVSKGTKIRPQFIEALEKGDYKKLPSSAYVQGFIKIYAEFLGLPKREILALFRREFNEREYIDVLPESFTNPSHRLFAGLRIGQATIVISIIFLFVLSFIFFQYKAALFAPSLVVISPLENQVITSPTTTVAGNTEQNVTVTIDDNPVVVANDGTFKKDIIVLAGTSNITVKAVNNFGRETTVVRDIKVALKP